MQTLRKFFAARNLIVVAACLLTAVVAIWATNTRANQNHFRLSIATDKNCMTPDCAYKEVANVHFSEFPGKHEFLLYSVKGDSAVYGGIPSTLARSGGSSESFFQHDGLVLENGTGCDVGLEFNDDKHLSLVGISTHSEDGFGPVQKFKPIRLNPGQIYRLMDLDRARGPECIFRPAKDGSLDFVVYSKPWQEGE